MSAIQLSPRTEELLRQKVENGRYASLEEAVDEAVQLLDARDRFERLKALIAEGLAELERGEGIEVTPGFWDEIEREAEEEDRLGLPLDPDVRA